MVANAEYVLAMELMAATQGLEYRLPLKPAREVARAAAVVRETSPALTEDRVLSGEIERLAQAVREGRFDEWRGQRR